MLSIPICLNPVPDMLGMAGISGVQGLEVQDTGMDEVLRNDRMQHPLINQQKVHLRDVFRIHIPRKIPLLLQEVELLYSQV
jgi:hypothetical protein